MSAAPGAQGQQCRTPSSSAGHVGRDWNGWGEPPTSLVKGGRKAGLGVWERPERREFTAVPGHSPPAGVAHSRCRCFRSLCSCKKRPHEIPNRQHRGVKTNRAGCWECGLQYPRLHEAGWTGPCDRPFSSDGPPPRPWPPLLTPSSPLPTSSPHPPPPGAFGNMQGNACICKGTETSEEAER